MADASQTLLDVGDGRILSSTFTDENGDEAQIQAEHVHVTLRAPDGTEETWTGGDLTVAGGVVSCPILFTMPGTYSWCIEWSDGSSSPQADEGSQVVRAPRVSRQNT